MRNSLLNYLTLVFALVAFPLLIINYFKSGAIVNIYAYTGLALIVPAFILFAIARIQLGSSFQVSAEAKTLVTSGIYKKFRHPIYYFGLTFILGLIIFFQVFYLVIVWFLLIFLQRSRIKNEEKVLEEKFGEQYREYKKNTWF